MKSFTYIVFFLALGSLISCTEVITLDLNDSEPTLVIEATLNGQDNTISVLLTESGSFINPGDYPSVSDALITLTESSGENMTVPEVEPGVYSLTGVTVLAGESYSLSVVSGEKEHLANVTVPDQIEVDSISFEASATRQFGEGLSPTLHYQTASGEAPWLRVRITTASSLYPTSFLPLENVMRPTSSSLLQASYPRGEKLRMEIQAISEEMYRYFEDVSGLKGESFGPGAASAAPSNPDSQWTGSALGYFNAHIPFRIEVVVP